MNIMKNKRLVILIAVLAVLVMIIVPSALVMFVPRNLAKLVPDEDIVSIQCTKYKGIYEDDVLTDIVLTDYELQEDKYPEFFSKIEALTYKKENFINATRYRDPYSITITYGSGATVIFNESDYKMTDSSGKATKAFGIVGLNTNLLPVYQLFDQEIVID